MTTPTKREILDKAAELFHRDNKLFVTPEEDELKESGYFAEAQHLLMQGENAEALSFLEQQANEMGFRLVPESQQTDMIDYKRKIDRLKQELKRAKSFVKPLVQTQEPFKLDPSRVRVCKPGQIEVDAPVTPTEFSSNTPIAEVEDVVRDKYSVGVSMVGAVPRKTVIPDSWPDRKLEVCSFQNGGCPFLTKEGECVNRPFMGFHDRLTSSCTLKRNKMQFMNLANLTNLGGGDSDKSA